MRVRTAARRQAIVECAAKLFKAHGYERTTMSEIAAHLGGSKSTLYGYFRTKEELFAAVVLDAVQAHGEALFALLTEDRALIDILRSFGRHYLELNLSPDVVALNRIMIAEGERAGVGAEMFDQGPGLLWHKTANFLARKMAAGQLRKSDPHQAAIALKSLLESDLIDRRLRGAITKVPPPEIARSVEQSLAYFMKLFGA